jgi:hypothetical protein
LKPAVSKAKNRLRHDCDREPLTIQCLKCGHNRVILGGSRDRTCPACGRELYYRFLNKYEKIVSSKKDLKLLTLTWNPVPRQDPEIVRKIGGALVKLLHRKPYRSVWKGLLASLECKKTSYGWFYYHIHAIISGGFIGQAQISKDWKDISGFHIVDIRRIWRTKKRALRYVLKYVSKGFAFKNYQDRLDFKNSMRGVRYVRSYGSFYNFNYERSAHVPFPCPSCGAVYCWVILDFCKQVALELDSPYLPFSGG